MLTGGGGGGGALQGEGLNRAAQAVCGVRVLEGVEPHLPDGLGEFPRIFFKKSMSLRMQFRPF